MHSNTDTGLPNLPDAPQWTDADDKLAKEAAAIIGKDGWAEELTRAVGEPNDYRGNGSSFILRMSVSVKKGHPGGSRVSSNWLGSKKRTRAGLIHIGVSLPATTADGSGPGVYTSKEAAVMDKLRFGFWVKMRCADLAMLLRILQERHRDQFAAYLRAVNSYRTAVSKAREEEQLQLKRVAEKRRQSLGVRVINYDNCAEVYRELHRKLCKGHHEQMNWERSFETDKEMQEAWSAKKERIRWGTHLKVQALMML